MRRILSIFLVFICLLCQGRGQGVRIWEKGKAGRLQVSLTPFFPEAGTANGTSVIVCPGGSYFWLDRKVEGEEVARWLAAQGITAFLLEYRTGGKVNFVFGTRLLYGGNHFPHMLQDVQKAILHVRNNAAEYGVDPCRLGVMGFSAGGHLAMLSAEKYGPEYLQRCGTEVNASLRPDFVAPIYPVVTMTDTRYRHNKSKRGLLGEYRMNNRKLHRQLSLELNVPDDCCPVFLVNCQDDPVVNYHNSVLLDSALTQKNISHRYICYPVGGHGFGCRQICSGADVYDWKEEFLRWLEKVLPSGAASYSL